MEVKCDGEKLKYEMITRWGKYEYHCDMEVNFRVPKNVEQINDYLFYS